MILQGLTSALKAISKSNLLKQLNLFYLALSFFTRIPVPSSMQYSESLLNQSARYFSLVGWLLAMILLALTELLSPYFPTEIIIVLIMIISVMLTGAFHEDGLADMADGIGGGLTVEKRLSIMKDSRIGTYGTVSLVLTLLLKFMLLHTIISTSYLKADFALVLITAYALSRAVAASLIYTMPYVADIDTSKSKPLAQRQTFNELLTVVVIGMLPLFFFSSATIVMVVVALLIFRQLFSSWLMARLGGYTGDCLGACQQIAELLIYLLMVATLSAQNHTITGSGVFS